MKIDKVVEQSAEEVMRGMDVQLQAAIDYLQGVNIWFQKQFLWNKYSYSFCLY